MTLLDAPLPRMAGLLPFLRVPGGTIDGLRPGMVAAFGAAVDGDADDEDTGLGPRALRETSAYFGSHFAAGMARPMDVDRRRPLDTGALAGRLVDLGDLDPAGAEAVRDACAAIAGRGAVPLLLGGPLALAAACRDGCARALGRPVALLRPCGAAGTGPAHVALDLADIGAPWHGARHASRFDGMGLREARAWLRATGRAQLAGVSITGLAPARTGLSLNKAGQRLLLTAILDLLYDHLDVLGPAA